MSERQARQAATDAKVEEITTVTPWRGVV